MREKPRKCLEVAAPWVAFVAGVAGFCLGCDFSAWCLIRVDGLVAFREGLSAPHRCLARGIARG